MNAALTTQHTALCSQPMLPRAHRPRFIPSFTSLWTALAPMFSAAAAHIAMAWVCNSASAFQIENPVYVDDSPQAWELFRQAQDQSRNNAGEAIRLYQELLDDYAFKLIPVGAAASDEFKSVRERVLAALTQDSEGGLLERYRLIQTNAAKAMLDQGELERAALTRTLTEPGLEAALRLAQTAMESGRFNAALFWLGQTRHHPDLGAAGALQPDQVRRAVHHAYMTGVSLHALGDAAGVRNALAALTAFGNEGQACRTALETMMNAADAHRHAADSKAGPVLDDLVAQAIWTVDLEDSLASRRRAARAAEHGDQPLPNSGPQGPESRGLADSSQRYRDAELATAAAAVADQTVFVNEGHTVRAVHRLTGRETWRFSNINRVTLTERDVTAALDMNTLAVVKGPNGCVVTLTGHAQANSRSEAGRVICLDAETGSLRWSTNLASPPLVDAPFNEQLFPHGTPVVMDGMVFVAARRVSMQAITSSYVVALDLDSGNVRWVRTICSSGGLRAGIRPFDSIVLHSDRSPASTSGAGLFVATAVGAIARLEPVSGEISWLSRYSAPMNVGIADYIRRPWEIGGPVVTPRGVLAIQPDQRRVLLMDALTGSLLETHDSSASSGWNQPRYLLADDERVYAIGTEIRAFDLEVLDLPAWRLPALAQSIPGQRTTTDSLDIRGRVQLIDGLLIVPTAQGVVIVDARSGTVKNTLALDTVGNPLAVESQLLLACSDRLDAYMSFATAQRMLRERIAQQPGEPEPAISLLRLAMRVRNLKLSLEAADLAMTAINSALPTTESVLARRTAARGELVSLLLELATIGLITNSAEGESVFAAVSAAAIDRPQRVEYLLAYGDWLAGHAINRAVEAWQSILSEPSLAATWRTDPESRRGDRPASAWAAERLADLIERRGAIVYAPQNDFAAMRLRQLVAAPEQDADRMSALAAEFPFSSAAVEAAIRAARINLKRDQPRDAAIILLQHVRTTTNAQAALQLVGALIDVCAHAGWPAQAAAVARYAIETYGDQPVRIGAFTGPDGAVNLGESMLLSVWLTAHSGSDRGGQTARLPVIGSTSNSRAQPIGGSIVEPYRLSFGAPATSYPADRVLLHEDETVRLIASPGDPADAGTVGREPLWTINQQPDRPQLLRFTDRDILLWINSNPQDPRAVMLNAADGTVRWTTPRLDGLLGDPVTDLGRTRGVREQMPDGEPFDPMQTVPFVGNESIFLIQRTGAVAAVSLADGTTLQWALKHGAANGGGAILLDQVHAAALHDGALVLAGSGPGVEGGPAPRLLALDPRTGRSLMAADQPNGGAWSASAGSGVKWMQTSPLGELIIGSVEGIQAIDIYSGATLWRTASYAATDSQRAWVLGDRLLLEDQRGRLRMIHACDGSIGEPFESPLRGEWDPSELRQAHLIHAPAGGDGTGPRVIAHYPQRVVMYDAASGAVVGVDVISDDRDFRFMLLGSAAPGGAGGPALEGGQRLVLVNSRVVQTPIADQPGRRAQQWIYRIYVLSQNCKVLSEPLELDEPLNERVHFAMLLDGTLLLSTPSETLAIPLTEP